MKKVWLTATLLALLISVAVAGSQQWASELFDSAKAQKEIEIMKSILETALSFEGRSRGPFVYSTSGSSAEIFAESMTVNIIGQGGIDGFYLYGQGTSFILSISPLPSDPTAGYDKLREEIDELKNSDLSPTFKALQIRYLESQLKRTGRSRGGRAFAIADFGPMADAEKLLYQATGRGRAPSPEQEGDVTEAEVAERMAKLEAAYGEARSKAIAEREEAMAKRGKFEDELLQTVANHGDSLTHLANDEFINLILASNSKVFYTNSRRGRSGTQILSVKKSDILDYKSGSIDFAGLQSRVLRYSY